MKRVPHIFAVGNAMVDIIVAVPDQMLHDYGLEKGRMLLVDEVESARRHGFVAAQKPSKASGGSTGNTAAIIASLGGRATFVGKTGADELGEFYASDMKRLGVQFINGQAASKPTANCLAMITPDGERTMSTFLGACQLLDHEDVVLHPSSDADIVFVEGYLLDAPSSRDAAIHTARTAAAQGRKVAVTLSDKNCVQRNLGAFYHLAKLANIVIGNDSEMMEFWKVSSVADVCSHASRASFETVMTRGAEGSTVVVGGQVFNAAAEKVARIADLVGAGDAFAGGYLYAHASDMGALDRLRIGNKCAAVVVESVGARPHTPLSEVMSA